MAIHIYKDKLYILNFAFEARCKFNFSFIDRQGEFVGKMRSTHPEWIPSDMNPNFIVFKNYKNKNIVARCGVNGVNVQMRKKIELPLFAKLLPDISVICNKLYDLYFSIFGHIELNRLGAYFDFLAAADTLEESDKVMYYLMKGDTTSEISKLCKMDHVEGVLMLILEDSDTGQKRRIALKSLIDDQPPGSENTGIGRPSGSGGLNIDIDTYEMPSGTNINSELFINTQFEKTAAIASEFFLWAVKKR